MKETIPITAYEPILSEETIILHNQLYQKYKNRLTKLIGEQDAKKAVLQIDQYPISDRGSILYNAGGVLNHQMYFEEINKNGRHTPSGSLKTEIEKQYGSYEKFKQEFKKVASFLVGSGYTFLVFNQGKLDIVNMSNQETPYLYGMTPIMNIDLWEHSYYLDYQIKRDSYIDSFFELLDYDVIDKRYEKIKTTKN